MQVVAKSGRRAVAIGALGPQWNHSDADGVAGAMAQSYGAAAFADRWEAVIIGAGAAGKPMDAAQTLGKYEIRGTLGKGAMGTVYDGWDPAIARRVAIKTVNLPADPDPDTAEQIARFRREAQAAGRLTHPNIVAVYDYGETADVAYIVMEFVDGSSLKVPLDNHERFAMTDIQQVMDDLLAGLQFSHDRGVVHRDIKPANIMLTLDGRVKIADFGIARIEMSSMTQAGTMLGTPSYMSPEQFMGQMVDARTDVYAAGVVLYQMLTGERPFDGGLTALMHKVLNTEPPAPSQLAVTAPRGLDAVVRRAMAKRPDDRYPSAAAFAAAIRGALAASPAQPQGEPEMTLVRVPQARPTQAPSRPVAPADAASSSMAEAASASGRSRAPLLIGIGVVGVLALGAGGWFVLGRSPPASGPPQVSPVSGGPTSAVPAQPVVQTPPMQSTSPGAATQDAPVAAPSAPLPLAASSPQAAAPVTSSPAASPPDAASPVASSPAASLPSTSSPDTSSPVASLSVAPPPRASSAPASSPTAASPTATSTATSPPAAAPPSASPSGALSTATVSDVPHPPAAATMAPKVIQQATTDLHVLRESVTQALVQAPCALANGLVQDSGTVSIAGYVGSDGAAPLRQQLADVAGAAPLDWRVQQVDPVFCSALGLLRPIAAQAGAPLSGLSLTLAGGQSTLHDGQRIMPRVTMADFAGEMRVDYLGHDGSVVHLYPTLAEPAQHVVARPATRLAAGAELSIGDAGQGKPIWEVGPPYGVDMIIAVASTTPLLARSPAQNATDDAAPYLRDLMDGIQRVRGAGGKVSGTLMLINTLPK